ncbi:hypothetical protein U5801_14260 [Lamprobacter modestohalophilus]|uniref:hypothetical protein n=1 Tax=Lamprobacter modestohalophilus TaxID=1064514 RepID=UPI002ADEB1C7|nr:hypothetical protein [Lamprobacter modestohalophilus]MEA1050963.1 hypothetical protein [Lamprobacter modestohalophilus]
MTPKPLVLKPGGLAHEEGWMRLDWRLEGDDSGDIVLSHSVSESQHACLDDCERGDHALCAVLLKAMQQGQDIIIEGQVSPRLLDGLDTLQAVWQRWRPRRYRRVNIHAAEESEAPPISGERPTVFAFSGGVDASFSLFRHLQGHAGRNNRKPGAALLVHGMDIPLDRDDFYNNAAARAERMLEDTGVPLIRMRSNSRQLRQDWEDSFGLQLSACFLVLQQAFAYAVRGSGEPYDTLVLPWGSTPLTDPLCSTAAMQSEHDGCAFDRTEKVHWLSTHTHITSELRVCWAGENLDRNCGECEKCVRTMLNFWATGLPIPSAFPNQLTANLVRSIRPRNEAQLREVRSLYRHAQQHHSEQDAILGSLRGVLYRATLKHIKQSVLYYGRRILRKS